MKKILIAISLLVIISGVASATNITTYSLNFDIKNDLSVKETINIEFEQGILASNLSYSFDGEISNIAINSDKQKLNFIKSVQNGKTIIKPVDEIFIQNLTIEFTTKNLVFTLDTTNLFFTEFSTQQSVENLVFTVTLPEGFGITDDSYTEGGVVTSNGRRITIKWNFIDRNSESITVKFDLLQKNFNILVPVVFALVIIIVFVYFRFKKKTKENFMKGFSEDEKKVIDYMEKHPISYQNKIEHEFKFSRAKMTRIVQKFEAKGLIEKRKKGRTNRLTYKK